MTFTIEPRQAARFLRTLRVATGLAASLEDMRRGGAVSAPAARFLALAAKTGDAWLFPAEGLLSADGLLLARRAREADGASALLLNAQGAVGVATFAGRAARLRVGSDVLAEGAFDRVGAWRVALPAEGFGDEALARFEVEFLDEAP